MNRKTHGILYTLIAFVLCLVFGATLLMYALPMKDVSLDLSIGLPESEEGTLIVPDNIDRKGWTVYTRDGETVTELVSDGLFTYTGLELGQTFYFSRVMNEDLDSPTLQIAAGECTFSVWLDDTLIYTDRPDLDNRIGYVTLPMNDQYRESPILISLPMDYQSKTLTIAQSFPEWSETGSVKAFPASVKLYCGYAYESEIISESFITAFVSAVLFLVGIVLLAAAVRNRDAGVLCLSLTAFLQMTIHLMGASFFYEYYGTDENNAAYVLPLVSAGAIFVFLFMNAGKHRKFFGGLTGVYLISVAVSGALLFLYPTLHTGIDAVNFLTSNLPFWLAFACVVTVLVFGVVLWRKEKSFYRLFTPLALGFTVLYWLAAVLIFERGIVWQQIVNNIGNGDITYIYHRTLTPVVIAALFSTVVEAVRREINRRIEKAAMEERHEMVLGSYENMRRQHEEIMMLRHDMAGHFEAMKAIAGNEQQITAYLDNLISKNKKVRSVVQTGNKMLDIILNNKLSHADDEGIHVDVIKTQAPEALPLSDADLCSLVMNIVDNAVNAASVSDAEEPFIRIDIHVKNDYFALTVENSTDTHIITAQEKTETVPRHGWGLKIIYDIVERYSGLVDTEQTETSYKIRVAIPLFTP